MQQASEVDEIRPRPAVRESKVEGPEPCPDGATRFFIDSPDKGRVYSPRTTCTIWNKLIW